VHVRTHFTLVLSGKFFPLPPPPSPFSPPFCPFLGGWGGRERGEGGGPLPPPLPPGRRGGAKVPPPAFIAVCPLVRQKISRIYLKIKLKNIYNYKIFCIYLDKVLVWTRF
jgi:hypothetical protein